MSKSVHLIGLLTSLAIVGAPLSGQTAAVHEGAFARVYPDAAAVVAGAEAAHAGLLAALLATGGTPRNGTDESTFVALVAGVESGSGVGASVTNARRALSRAAPRFVRMTDAAQALQREILDIHAEDRVVNKAAAVDAAVDRYLTNGEVALAAVPKAMEVVSEQPHAGAFRTTLPRTTGVLWASHWLQLALYDPLMYFAEAEERRAGVDVVVGRFRAKIADVPGRQPIEMPTPAAISPELTRRYPRAAAILDNLHMLQRVVADILVAADPRAETLAIDEAVIRFADPEYRDVTDYEWLVMSLRHGIYNQGGPAIGTLERSERNVGAHAAHGGATVLSGMGSGPDGESVVGETGDPVQPPPSDELDPHAGH